MLNEEMFDSLEDARRELALWIELLLDSWRRSGAGSAQRTRKRWPQAVGTTLVGSEIVDWHSRQDRGQRLGDDLVEVSFRWWSN